MLWKNNNWETSGGGWEGTDRIIWDWLIAGDTARTIDCWNDQLNLHSNTFILWEICCYWRFLPLFSFPKTTSKDCSSEKLNILITWEWLCSPFKLIFPFQLNVLTAIRIETVYIKMATAVTSYLFISSSFLWGSDMHFQIKTEYTIWTTCCHLSENKTSSALAILISSLPEIHWWFLVGFINDGPWQI